MQNILRLLLWVLIIITIVYIADIIGNTNSIHPIEPPKQLDYTFDADFVNPDKNYEDPCARISYEDESMHQTSFCPKIRDIYDEKVDKLSNYSDLKENNMQLTPNSNYEGHLGEIFNSNEWSYENEQQMSGGAIYQHGDKNIYAHDDNLQYNLAL